MPRHKNETGLNPDAGPGQSGEDGPVRQCAVTRERLPQARMVRFVVGPDGVVAPDVAGKLPGRGAWVTAERDVVEAAVSKGAFKRAFKRDVAAPADLVGRVESLLLARCQGLLGLAKKSGQAVLGFDQVRAELRKAEPGWILEASDGAEDGRNKVHFLAKALYGDVNTAGALDASELGMAFARPRVIHGLLRQGSLADHWATAYHRLTGFRLAPEAAWFSGRDL